MDKQKPFFLLNETIAFFRISHTLVRYVFICFIVLYLNISIFTKDIPHTNYKGKNMYETQNCYFYCKFFLFVIDILKISVKHISSILLKIYYFHICFLFLLKHN